MLAVAVAALLGALHALSFGPWPAWWLQTLSLAGFVWLWLRTVRPPQSDSKTAQAPPALRRQALILTAVFSVFWFGIGLCWLYVSMHDFGGLPAVMAAAAVVLCAAYLSLYPLAALELTARLTSHSDRPGAGFAVVFAAAWTLGEFLRGLVFTGFPWLAIGYAHVDSPLSAWAPLLGVYGVCGLAAFMAAVLALVLDSLTRQPPSRLHKTQVQVMVVAVALLLGAGLLLRSVQWSQPHGPSIQVRLLQGNVPQQLKFDPRASRRAMLNYSRMATQPGTSGKVDLTVMPETAWTIPWPGTDPAIVSQLFPPDSPTASSHYIAIGMPLGLAADASAREISADMILHARIANSVLVLRGDRLSDLSQRYDKHHLVPFGEYVPWGFDWFVRMMQIPLGNFARGSTDQSPLEIAGQRVAFDICYEDLFGEELAASVRASGGNAGVLVNISNIAWFGNSHALPQHLQIARMRAIELARPMLRSTNTGMTASIDPTGKVRAVLEPYTVGVLEDQVQGMRGDTPYARFTNAPVLLVVFLLLLIGFIDHRRRTRRG